MKRTGMMAVAVVTVVATLTLSGCGINWSRHEELLAGSDAQKNILAAGAPSVTDASSPSSVHE